MNSYGKTLFFSKLEWHTLHYHIVFVQISGWLLDSKTLQVTSQSTVEIANYMLIFALCFFVSKIKFDLSVYLRLIAHASNTNSFENTALNLTASILILWPPVSEKNSLLFSQPASINYFILSCLDGLNFVSRWTDYIEDLGWNRLGLRPSEMMEVMEDREVWWLNLELLPPQPSWKSGQWRKKKKILSCNMFDWTSSIALCYAVGGCHS